MAGQEGDPKLPRWAELDNGDPFKDVLWQYKFTEGRVLFTAGARKAYGLDPVARVEPYDEDEEFIPDILRTWDIPGIRLSIVGPHELERALETLAQERDVDVPDDLPADTDYYFTGAGRDIDILMSFQITQHDSQAQQEAYLKQYYGRIWPEYRNYLDEAGGFQYLLGHLVPNNVERLAISGLVKTIGEQAMWPANERFEPTFMVYGSNISYRTHALFCREVHADQAASSPA